MDLDSASLKFWQLFSEWGFWLVIIGVFGESVDLAIKWLEQYRGKETNKTTHRWVLSAESFFWIVLCVGLAMEFLGGHKAMLIANRQNALLTLKAGEAKKAAAAAIERAAVAEKEAGQANDRASTNELAAKQLEKQLTETKTQLATAEARLNESVIELKKANLPIDIGEQYSFAEALKALAGTQVELRTSADVKAQQTAESLRSTFVMAGWPVIHYGLISDIGEQGIVIGFNADGLSRIHAVGIKFS